MKNTITVMATSRDARADADRRVQTNAKRGGPFAGWTWRDARRAMQFGKREGAYGVRFPNGVKPYPDECRIRKKAAGARPTIRADADSRGHGMAQVALS